MSVRMSQTSNRFPCHAPILHLSQACGAKGVPITDTAGSRTASAVLDEGALKKDPAEAKAPAADTVDSDAEAHTLHPPPPQSTGRPRRERGRGRHRRRLRRPLKPLALGLHERRQGCER